MKIILFQLLQRCHAHESCSGHKNDQIKISFQKIHRNKQHEREKEELPDTGSATTYSSKCETQSKTQRSCNSAYSILSIEFANFADEKRKKFFSILAN